jgi:molecular chaperone DnaK (HSP70)
MPGRLAIDFGTSNTVVALWDDSQGEALPLILPDFSRNVAVAGAQGEFGEVPIIPSLIHYVDKDRRWIGQQVFEQELYEAHETFRWMKRFVSRRMPMHLNFVEGKIFAADAARDFLTAILATAAAGVEVNPQEEDIVLTVPVESFEHYNRWLLSVAHSAGLPRVRLIDEAAAAAIGYGAHVEVGDAYLTFDFGGGSLDVSVVTVEEENTGGEATRYCRVLGKAGSSLGGATLDQWLLQDIMEKAGANQGAEDVRRISRKLLVDCERAKETLSLSETAEVNALDIYTGLMLNGQYTRTQFEQMLEERGFFTTIDRTIRRALDAARARGCDEDRIKAVFMLGGSSLIPSVQQAVTGYFGGDRVLIDRPLEAVACGAATFAAGADLRDYIQHDYAIRHIDQARGDYDYRPIVRRGTAFPTAEPVAKVVLKPSHADQAKLGVALFEVGDPEAAGDATSELMFGSSGAVKIVPVTPEEQERRSRDWLNEQDPQFLHAEPPGPPGEPRFEVQFGVDANMRLVVSAQDVQTGQSVMQEVPVADQRNGQ